MHPKLKESKPLIMVVGNQSIPSSQPGSLPGLYDTLGIGYFSPKDTIALNSHIQYHSSARWVVSSGRHFLGGRLNELTFKVLFSSGKSLIPGDKRSGFYRMVEENELLLASANVLTHRAHPCRGTGGPAVQTVSQDGFDIAAGPELRRDRKLGV